MGGAVTTRINAAGTTVQSDIGEWLDVSAFIAPGVELHQVEIRIGDSNANGSVVIVDVEDAVKLAQQLLEVARACGDWFESSNPNLVAALRSEIDRTVAS